jgi:hypothetical protein
MRHDAKPRASTRVAEATPAAAYPLRLQTLSFAQSFRRVLVVAINPVLGQVVHRDGYRFDVRCGSCCVEPEVPDRIVRSVSAGDPTVGCRSVSVAFRCGDLLLLIVEYMHG